MKYSGYDKVLFVMVKDPVVDKHKQQTGLFTSVVNSRASISVNAFLADKSNVIKASSSTKEDDSEASELRAKRGAFRKCLQEISKNIDLSK